MDHPLRTEFAVPDAASRRTVRDVTVAGLVINVLLAAAKFAAGVVGRSQALIADAVHSLSDCVTDVVVLVGARFWLAPADAEHPYGHQRIETLVTFLIGLVLGIVGVGLGWRAVVTLQAKHEVVPGWLAFGVAVASILAKEGLYQWSIRQGRRVRSSALLANAWHHRSDGLSSLPVAVAVLAARLQPTWSFLDHVATIIVSLLVGKAAWDIAAPACRELIDAGARKDDRDRILALAGRIPGVIEIHALRTRRTGPGLQVDLHVLVDPELTVREGHDIAIRVRRELLENGPEIVDALVHIEPSDET